MVAAGHWKLGTNVSSRAFNIQHVREQNHVKRLKWSKVKYDISTVLSFFFKKWTLETLEKDDKYYSIILILVLLFISYINSNMIFFVVDNYYTHVVGFLGVISTGAPGDGISIANISTHNSILP